MRSPAGVLAAASLCLALCVSSSSAQAAYTFIIDNFQVTRSGAAFFNDDFSDGVPPPNAPNFASGTPAAYAVTGTLGPETGGKLAMNSSGAVANPAGFPTLYQGALLNTNTSTAAADASKGLKSGFTFTVLGLFDLAAPGPVGEMYGIRLTDKTATSNGTDTYSLVIRRETDNNLYVDLRYIDYNTVTSTTLEKIALDPAHSQILLSLDHSDALSNAIHASFSYVDGGVVGGANLFSTTPTIFNSVNFTRAGFDAATPVPLPAAVWLLGSGLVGVVVIGRKRRVS